MKLIIKSNNCGYGDSTEEYYGPFVGEWQIACRLSDLFKNKMWDRPYKTIEKWAEYVKTNSSVSGKVCEGGGFCPDYAYVECSWEKEEELKDE